MIDAETLETLAKRIEAALPPSVRAIHEQGRQHLRTLIVSILSDFDWGPREEVEAQVRVLQKTRERVMALEQRLKDLEAQLDSKSP